MSKERRERGQWEETAKGQEKRRKGRKGKGEEKVKEENNVKVIKKK